MDRTLRNRLLIFLVLAGVIAFALVQLSGRQPTTKVNAVMPSRSNIVSSVSSNGKVEPVAPSVVRAQLDTFVQKIHITEGQQVKRGQLLLELDVKDATAQLARAREKLLRAESDLETAKAGGRSDEAAKAAGDLAKATAERDRLQRNHEALLRLVTQQAATRDELTMNDQQLKAAQAEVDRLAAVKAEFERNTKLNANGGALQVQQAQNEVSSLEEKVRGGRITAEADGTLYSLPVRQGDFVKMGDLLAEVADLHRVRVRAFVDEPDLGGLEPGEPVRITWDALPNRFWEGTTEVIPKQVVPRGSRSVGELLCSVNNDKLELLPNVNVDVRINSRERNNVLTIPRGAVEAEGTRRYVFVVKDSQLGVGKKVLTRREIRVGIADAASYEVTSGLTETDLIALPGDSDLRDGMYVVVTNLESLNLQGQKDAN